jgi:myo-inositol catabolism protein IolS
MEYLNIDCGISISRLCFGCEQLGLYNWGDLDEGDLSKAVAHAVDSGVNFFDTADVYGLGSSERNLSKFLGENLSNVIISTKFGVRFNQGQRYFDNSEVWINEALEGSLKRLGRDYIDIYIMHYWDEKTPLDEILDTLLKLQSSGKIRTFGFSNLVSEQIGTQFASKSSVFSYEFSLINTEKEEVIKKLVEHSVFMAYGALGQGILSGKYSGSQDFKSNDRRSSDKYVNFHGGKLQKNLEIVKRITIIARKYSVTPAQVALRWLMDKYQNSVVITGIKNVHQLNDNISIFKWKLDTEDMDTLNKLKL